MGLLETLDQKPGVHYEPIFVARQPIFARDDSIWGYELLFRHGDEKFSSAGANPDQATAKVIIDGLAMAAPTQERDKKFLINFPRNLLMSEAALALPKECCIPEVLEDIAPDSGAVAALTGLKQAGYTIALDDYTGSPGYEPLLKLADIIKVDVLEMDSPQLIKVVGELRPYQAMLLAEKVENKRTHDLCKAMGFSLFQGYYYSKPVLIQGRKVSPMQLSKLQVLKELSNEDYEVAKLTRIIAGDVSLSYRLLKFINSAAFSLPQAISSIAQAVTLLGADSLRQWLTVMLLVDTAQNQGAELLFNSVHRGRFLELATQDKANFPFHKDTMFLLGVFSRLDAIFNMPMEEVTAPLPLAQEIKDALNGKPNQARLWLELLQHLEQGRWDDTFSLLNQFQVKRSDAAVQYLRARIWASEVIGYSRRSKKDRPN